MPCKSIVIRNRQRIRNEVIYLWIEVTTVINVVITYGKMNIRYTIKAIAAFLCSKCGSYISYLKKHWKYEKKSF